MIGRIPSRAIFGRLREDGRRRSAGPLTVVRAPLGEGDPPDGGVAFAVPRRVGSAVVRNRVRRRLREQFRALDRSGELPPEWFLVIVRPGAASCSSAELADWLKRAVAGGSPVGRPT